MADAAVFVGWGGVARGREVQALQVFTESQAYYGRLQASGAIESFETVILQPHGGDLAGFIVLRGERAKLDEVVASDEFQTLTVRASMIADNVGVVNAAIGGSLAEGIARFQAAIPS
jgi:hypothetical protein